MDEATSRGFQEVALIDDLVGNAQLTFESGRNVQAVAPLAGILVHVARTGAVWLLRREVAMELGFAAVGSTTFVLTAENKRNGPAGAVTFAFEPKAGGILASESPESPLGRKLSEAAAHEWVQVRDLAEGNRVPRDCDEIERFDRYNSGKPVMLESNTAVIWVCVGAIKELYVAPHWLTTSSDGPITLWVIHYRFSTEPVVELDDGEVTNTDLTKEPSSTLLERHPLPQPLRFIPYGQRSYGTFPVTLRTNTFRTLGVPSSAVREIHTPTRWQRLTGARDLSEADYTVLKITSSESSRVVGLTRRP